MKGPDQDLSRWAAGAGGIYLVLLPPPRFGVPFGPNGAGNRPLPLKISRIDKDVQARTGPPKAVKVSAYLHQEAAARSREAVQENVGNRGAGAVKVMVDRFPEGRFTRPRLAGEVTENDEMNASAPPSRPELQERSDAPPTAWDCSGTIDNRDGRAALPKPGRRPT